MINIKFLCLFKEQKTPLKSRLLSRKFLLLFAALQIFLFVSNIKRINFTAIGANLVRYVLIYVLTFLPPLTLASSPVYANDLPITVDGTTSTQIDAAANNVPVVNIAAPNAGGLSHNTFTDYNVNKGGLILNNATNSQDGVVLTQIGGYIADNANLKNSGSANIILNEVTSTNRSFINGHTEIAGRAADLILANPNGVVLNGGGFINTSRLSIVVGASNQLNPHPDNLTFNLEGNKNAGNNFLPKITISGTGVDFTKVTDVDLVASVMEIVAPIYAGDNNLNLRSADKEFNYKTKEVTSDNTNPGTNQPNEIAIDASALAKIQAGNIYVVANKEGFGVKFSGDMIASRNGIEIDAQGNINYKNVEAAKFTATSTNDVTHESGNVKSDDITLTAKNVTSKDGSGIATKNLTVTATDTFNIEQNVVIVNSKDDQGNQNSLTVKVDAKDFNNRGEIISLSDLLVESQNTIGQYGTLSATNNLTLRSVNADINNYNGAELLVGNQTTQGSLILEAVKGSINQLSPNSVVVNGNHTITATDYTNTGRIDISGNLIMNIANNLINDIGALIYAGGNMFLNVVNNLTNKTNATIYAENDLYIKNAEFTTAQQTALDTINSDITVLNTAISPLEALEAAGTITQIQQDDLTAKRAEVSQKRLDIANLFDNFKINKLENISGNIETYNGDIYIAATTIDNKRETLLTQGALPGSESTAYYKNVPIQQKHGIITHRYYRVTAQGTASSEGIINAKNNLTINSTTLNNNSSAIYAGNDMTINADEINNTSNLFRDYVVGRGWAHGIHGSIGLAYCAPLGIDCGAGGYWYTGTKDGYVNQAYTLASNIKAGKNLRGTIVSKINNDTIAQNVTGLVSATDRNSQTVNSISLTDLLNNGKVSSDLSKYLNGPTNQGMFAKSTNPNTPLFETRSQFVDLSKFFGSDYFYQKIGLNLTDVHNDLLANNKRLIGDAFFETKILEEQLRSIRKNSMLLSDSTTDVNSEIQSLLDNAADEYTRLGLSVNEAMTQSQIDSLQKDIIWFETETIDGSLYVVPKIYLTQATRDSLKNGDNFTTKSTIMALGDVQLNSDSLNNSGSIVGNNVTVTTNNDITNKNFSDIIAANNLGLTSNNGSIINFSKLKGGGAVSLTSAKDITNTSTVKTNDSNLLNSGNPAYVSNGSAESGSNISSSLFETAVIEAGTLTASAGNDFNNYGADINTTGNISITAGDDINIETVQLRNRSEVRTRKYIAISDTTKNIGSNITSAGNITLTTNGTGTDNESGTSDLGVGSSILVTGSKLTATGDLNLSANNNAIIMNAVDSDYSFIQNTKKGSIKTSRTSRTDYVETAVSSNLTGKNINITTNNNIYVQGSDLNSKFDTATNTGGNTNLTAANDTVIKNAILKEYHYTSKEVKNRGAFKGLTAVTSAVIGIVAGAVNLVANILDPLISEIGYDAGGFKDAYNGTQWYTMKTRTIDKNDLTKIVASNVNAGNDLTINSTNTTTIASSNLNSGTADSNNTNPAVTGKLEINSKDLNIYADSTYNKTTRDLRQSSAFTIKNTNAGNMSNDLTNSTLTAKNDNFTYNITNKADIRAKDLNDPTITAPSYVTALRAQLAASDISESTLEISSRHWEDTNREMTEAAMVGIAVAVVVATILTAGAAAPAAGAAAGGATAGVAVTAGASAGVAATAGATAIGISAATAATIGTVVTAATSAAIVAGISTVATTALVSATQASMNADGDMFKQAKTIGKKSWDKTTSKDSMENLGTTVLIAGLTAGITSGISESLSSTGSSTQAANGANNTSSTVNGASTSTNGANTVTSTSNNVGTVNNLASATSSSPTFLSNFGTALQESAISTVTSTAVQSGVNGDSFGDALKDQGVNILIGAVGNLGAKAIGKAAHGEGFVDARTGKLVTTKAASISKTQQLLLHAGLGCGMAAAGGSDCASGAVSGVVGELAAESLYGETRFNGDETSVLTRTGMNKDTAKELAGLAAGYSTIFTGNAVGLSDSEVADNIYSGQRIGKNAAENNSLLATALILSVLAYEGDGDILAGGHRVIKKTADGAGYVVDEAKKFSPHLETRINDTENALAASGEFLVNEGDEFISNTFDTQSNTPVTDGIVNANNYFKNQPDGIKFLWEAAGLGTGALIEKTAGGLLLRNIDGNRVDSSLDLNSGGVGNNSPGNIDFYAGDNGVYPATGYRAIVGDSAVGQARNGNIMSNNNTTYFTFDDIANNSSPEIKSLLQLKNEPSHIATFDTLQIIDDIKIPTTNWNTGIDLEPITTSYPNFGSGGATQAITNSPITNYNLNKITNGQD